MKISFEGHSDDTFGWFISSGGRRDPSAPREDDHDNAATGKPIVFRVADRSGHGLFVWGLYSPAHAPRATPGCWVIGIQQLDEGRPLPSWPMTWATAECHNRTSAFGYSPILEIDAPDDADITLVGADS